MASGLLNRRAIGEGNEWEFHIPVSVPTVTGNIPVQRVWKGAVTPFKDSVSMSTVYREVAINSVAQLNNV